jgi:hypothetical protein
MRAVHHLLLSAYDFTYFQIVVGINYVRAQLRFRSRDLIQT